MCFPFLGFVCSIITIVFAGMSMYIARMYSKQEGPAAAPAVVTNRDTDVETGTRRGSRQRVSTTVTSEVSDRSVPASAARVSKAGGKGERSKRLQAYVM